MSANNDSAEINFREAFERLKKNKPVNLPKNTPVTQNNVAKEAGRDTSGLRKSRYPFLVQDIQEYVMANEERSAKKKTVRDNRSRSLKQKLADHKNQISALSSIVNSQNKQIAYLLSEIQRLEIGTVSPLKTK